MIKNIRVGIPIIGAQSWSGGITYIELLVKAVSRLPIDERPQMFFVITDYTLDRFDLHQSFAHLFNGIFFLGQDVEKATGIIRRPFDHLTSYQTLFEKIDFYFPVLVSALQSNMCSASWIPDFQYVHLPQFFSQEESQARAASSKKVAEDATLVVLSSNDVKKDFQNQFPNSKAITRILSFHSLPDDECYKRDATDVQKRYDLPDQFLICCNQFWMHKNHILLLEALSKLRKNGTKVHLVCTGATEDHRSIGYFSQIQKLIIDLEIEDIVHILGYIPRNDQIQLIRCSLALVQPSLFEGWGTVLEDSRQFGKTIIFSDLPVHYEQNPKYGVYFNRNSADELVQTICRLLPTLTPGPDIERENEAKIESEKLVEDYARQFCAIAVESQFIFNKKIRNMSDNLWNLLTEPLSNDKVFISRDAHIETGKPLVYLDDIFSYLKESDAKICPIMSNIARPFWSVMLPTYKKLKYLEQTLRSVLVQALSPDEMQIEVVNDCPDPAIQDEMEALVKRVGDGRVQFYRHPQLDIGQAAIFNVCIERAQGQWVHILHDDDIVLPSFYKKMRDGIEKEPAVGMAFSRYFFMDENNRERFLTFLERETAGIIEDWLERIAISCRIHFPGTVVKRSVYEHVGGFCLEMIDAADWEMWIRIAAAGYKVWYETEPLAAWRQHTTSLSAKVIKSGQQLSSVRKVIELSHSYLPKEIANELSEKSREYYARYGLGTVRQMLSEGDAEAVINNICEVLNINESPQTINAIISLLKQSKDNSAGYISYDNTDIKRRQLAESWLKVPSEFLEKAYTEDMGNHHRKIMESNLRNEPLTQEENAFLQMVITELTKCSATDPILSINYLLAVMLYLPSGRLKIENARASLPGWLIGDYERFFGGAG